MTLLRIVYQSKGQTIPVSRLNIHPELLQSLHELGVVEICRGTIEESDLRRLYRIMRLRDFLGVNLNGAVIIADLLQRIEHLEAQIRHEQETR